MVIFLISNLIGQFTFAERINGTVGTDGGGKAHIDSRGLSHSNQTSFDQNRREIVEEDSPKNQEQSKFIFSKCVEEYEEL